MREITLFLCGDVMLGRGIDQVLPHPSEPRLYEPYAESALDYVRLAEEAHGPIPRPVGFDYVWGDALAEIERRRPHHRIGNLETAVTTSEDAEPKGINYRMDPTNLPCLVAAPFDCCSLANNHVLDWGEAGLVDTLQALGSGGIATAGAGKDAEEAARPAILPLGERGRVLVFGFAAPSSGVPASWAADRGKPGVALLPDLSPSTAERTAEVMAAQRRPGDVVVASFHWGGNWGYEVSADQRDFAHRLIDSGGADVVHGHSSHHPKAIERDRDRPVLFGCGDFVNDYEGIGGHEEYRPDLVLAYFATLDADSGRLVRLEIAPFRMRRFRLERVPVADAEWLRGRLDRESRRFGGGVHLSEDLALTLRG